jgi:hypothetical protein
MSEERHLLLQLANWLKREYSQNMATRAALQIAAHLYQPTTNSILGETVEQMTATKRHVDVEFRRFETALLDGSDYKAPLRSLLDRHQ